MPNMILFITFSKLCD